MSVTAPSPRTAVVIGASFAGLLAAAAAARDGYRVTILERDLLPTTAEPRPGVPQGTQAHILLHRGLLAIESLLPGIERDLLDAGGVPFNTGQMPSLGDYGWMPQNDLAYDIISISRPLLEHLVRQRVLALDDVTVREETRVSNLTRDGNRWQLHDRGDFLANADVLIDASGRSSRLPHWLTELGITVPEAVVVNSRLGYAGRRYRGRVPIHTGAVVFATATEQTGALVLPIENGDWLVCAAGYGEHRPDRDNEEFEPFLDAVRDPVVADIARRLEPQGDVAIHRQTANRRIPYGSSRDWPAGLFVVGDAMCAFNPVYGQGITVAASQAQLLRPALTRFDGSARTTRRIQRRLGAVTNLPWAVSTSEDTRIVDPDRRRTPVERATGWWTARMVALAAGGDTASIRAFARVYHLMGTPLLMFSPAVVRSIVGSLGRPLPPPGPRPEVLAELTLAPFDKLRELGGGIAQGAVQRVPGSGRTPSTK